MPESPKKATTLYQVDDSAFPIEYTWMGKVHKLGLAHNKLAADFEKMAKDVKDMMDKTATTTHTLIERMRYIEKDQNNSFAQLKDQIEDKRPLASSVKIKELEKKVAELESDIECLRSQLLVNHNYPPESNIEKFPVVHY